MPKIDPMTGVKVMTMGEFWQSEADRNGTSPAEEMTNFYKEMEEEVEKDRQIFLSTALDQICHYIHLQNEYLIYSERLEMPVELVETIDHEFSEGFKGSSGMLDCLVRMCDKTFKRVHMSFEEYNGSRWEPPDFECEIYYEPDV